MSKTAQYQPPHDSDRLVLAWLRRARESQMGLYEMADTFERMGRRLGYPVAVLTGLIAIGTFVSVATDATPVWAKLLVGLGSAAAAVLSTLQTNHGYTERSHRYKVAAARYGGARRELEELYADRVQGVDWQKLQTVRRTLDALAEEGLSVPQRIFARLEKRDLFVREDLQEESAGVKDVTQTHSAKT